MNRSALVLLGLLGFAWPAPADEAKDKWHDSFDAAMQTAKKENKPILLVFRCER